MSYKALLSGYYTFIGGLLAGYTFPALLMSFCVTYLVLTLLDESADEKTKARGDMEKMDNTPKENYNFLARVQKSF